VRVCCWQRSCELTLPPCLVDKASHGFTRWLCRRLAQRVHVCPSTFAHHPQLEDIYCTPLPMRIGTQNSNCQHIKSHRACSGDGPVLLARSPGCPKVHPVHLSSTDLLAPTFFHCYPPTLSPLHADMTFLLFAALPESLLPLSTNSCSSLICI
jgi:hypothetical protein